MLTAIVTAGGTREPIDDVRYIGNRSSGRLGADLCAALAGRGVRTTLLGSAEALRLPLDGRIERVLFASHVDLDRELERLIGEGPPDLLLMAAAVADYAPERLPGKLPSAAPELVLRLVRTPKILATLRQRCGARTLLAGFKLTSGTPHEQRVALARAQNERYGLDLTVANDLTELGGGDHPVTLVPAAGAPLRLLGPREAVARQLVDWLLEERG